MWPPKPAYNLVTAVENLEHHFRDLEFDANHEAVYGMGKFYTFEECEEFGERYRKVMEACRIYLHVNNLENLLTTIKDTGFCDFLDEVIKFAPKEIVDEVLGEK